MSKRFKQQAGFTLVSTLFLLVVLSSLGAYMVSLATAQHMSSAMSVNALRARYALTSGLEWAAYEINANAACPSLPAVVNVQAYQVSITACDVHTVTEGDIEYPIYDISVQAQRGTFGEPTYIQVHLQASLQGA